MYWIIQEKKQRTRDQVGMQFLDNNLNEISLKPFFSDIALVRTVLQHMVEK